MTRSTARHADPGSRAERAGPVLPAWQREGTLYVIGLDGLTLDVMGPMMESGELRSFAALKDKGACGPLGTVQPTNSSLLWTSIATGRHHRDHGIDGFIFYRVLGRRLSRTAVRKHRKAIPWGGAFRLSMKLLDLLGLRKRYHFDGRHIGAKTFWDVVSDAGGRVGVLNWWHSWPAQPINGFVVSDRLHYWRDIWKGKAAPEAHLTYPDGLVDETEDLVVPPDAVKVEDVQQFVNLPADKVRQLIDAGWRRRHPVAEIRWVVSANRTISRVFAHCLDAFPDLQMVVAYLRGPDIAQHAAFQYGPWAPEAGVSAEEREAFGNVVPQAYRDADEFVGRVLARMGPRDTLLVVSDHGYGLEGKAGGRARYGHRLNEPPGVIFAYGPEVRTRATVSGATVYDVAPTVLRLCGFPGALDMEGREGDSRKSPGNSRFLLRRRSRR